MIYASKVSAEPAEKAFFLRNSPCGLWSQALPGSGILPKSAGSLGKTNVTQTLSVTCKISEQDLRYFVEKKGRLVIWASRVIACAVPAYLAYLLIRYPRHRSGHDLLTLLPPIVFLILFTFYFGFFHYQQLARAMLKKNTAMREGSRYSFSENGVESEDLHGRAYLNWAGIQKAAEDERMFLLYLQNGAAVLLPKNCFGDETEIRKMKAILRAALQERAQLLP